MNSEHLSEENEPDDEIVWPENQNSIQFDGQTVTTNGMYVSILNWIVSFETVLSNFKRLNSNEIDKIAAACVANNQLWIKQQNITVVDKHLAILRNVINFNETIVHWFVLLHQNLMPSNVERDIWLFP